ncbi:translation initiation factor 2 [Aspergillus brunneoviolaceus CBS 621.78]|uniref:Initiation factor 2 n=1 Tax=Aspergillus brunneoviolaceus CBS 621.78 TaxID=1450534 RepID=A0ACD1G857_9EURO|nr:initiation factor 2 [Aspergillus brunneoviolaceus CBS 621.78]RAH45464.1 initiation factor 2 [Aspergillus brunneoviolaceus CBS 621.78]
MHRRAALELSRRQGVDWSCATARRNAAFAPVLNPVPRRGFRAFPACADSSDTPNGSEKPRKFAPRWGSKATRSVGLSPAEQAIRDAMVAKQQKKSREEQARQDALLAEERAKQERKDALIARQKAKEAEDQARQDANIARQKAKQQEEEARREALIAAREAKRWEEQAQKEALIARQKAKEEEDRARRDASIAQQRAKEEEEEAQRDALLAAKQANQQAQQASQSINSLENPNNPVGTTPSISSQSPGTSSPTGAKFTSRWGSKASRPTGLSAAEQAMRDALVAKQQAQQDSSETNSPNTPSESSGNLKQGSAGFTIRLGDKRYRATSLTPEEKAARDALAAKQQAQKNLSETTSETSDKPVDTPLSEFSNGSAEGSLAKTGFTIRSKDRKVQSMGLNAEEKAARDALIAEQQAQESPVDLPSSQTSNKFGTGRKFAAPRWGSRATTSTGLSAAEKAMRESLLEQQQSQHTHLHGDRSHSRWQHQGSWSHQERSIEQGGFRSHRDRFDSRRTNDRYDNNWRSSEDIVSQDFRRFRPDGPRRSRYDHIPEHLQTVDWTCPDCHYLCPGTERACPCCRAPRPELMSEQSNKPLTFRKLDSSSTPSWDERDQALDEYATRYEEKQRQQQEELEKQTQDKPQKSVNDWSWDTSALEKLNAGQEVGGSSDRGFKRRGGRAKPLTFADEDEFDTEDYQRRRQQKKDKKRKKREERKEEIEAEVAEPSPLYLPEFISVSNLADIIGVRQAQFIQRMEEMGFEDVTHSHILDAETAGLIAAEYNFEPIFDTGEDELTAAPEPEDKSSLPPRPPVVTIMGHVDHGKTTILDWLRKSSIVDSEHGGITQHIGAFSVSMPSGKTITFLDTPGHAAFLDMRRRGADITDIVVLVVAADDSVKPQTIEAIKHATAANVPIIVAMSKMDKEGVNPDRVKQDLSVHGVHVEDFGGDVQAIGVSGKTGAGMLELEEAIITLSEVLDHRADPTGNVEGWVVEGTTKSYGRVATVLIRRGTLRVGDIIVAGETWARVRTLRNESGVAIKEATPGMPVEVDGWREQPTAGTEFLQAENEQKAKSVVEYRIERSETSKLGEDTTAMNEARRELMERRRLEEAGLDQKEAQSGPKPIHFIIKADVHGSAEAVLNSVTAVGNNEVYANVLRAEVGPVSEFDIEHAASAGGHVISFNMAIDPRITQMAESRGVTIKDHNVIYRLIDDVKATLSEHLPPLVTLRVTGEAEIGEIFEIKLKGRERMQIAGCRVRNGLINRTKKVRVLRGQETIYTGTIASLKNVKKDVTEMRKDTECGMAFEGWFDFQVGDHVQCYEEIFEKRYL